MYFFRKYNGGAQRVNSMIKLRAVKNSFELKIPIYRNKKDKAKKGLKKCPIAYFFFDLKS